MLKIKPATNSRIVVWERDSALVAIDPSLDKTWKYKGTPYVPEARLERALAALREIARVPDRNHAKDDELDKIAMRKHAQEALAELERKP